MAEPNFHTLRWQQFRKALSPFEQDENRLLEYLFEAEPARFVQRIQTIYVDVVDAHWFAIFMNQSERGTRHVLGARDAATFDYAFR